jgi:hypothetical protein
MQGGSGRPFKFLDEDNYNLDSDIRDTAPVITEYTTVYNAYDDSKNVISYAFVVSPKAKKVFMVISLMMRLKVCKS